MHTAGRFRRAWWQIREELQTWAMSFIAAIPGALGARLRFVWMRRHLQHLGEGTVLKVGLRITSPEKVSIGAHCDFASDVFITGGGGVEIGDWVGFGPGVKVWSVNHRFEDPNVPWLLQGWDKKKVVIEDDVWLGANVFVMPGVTIGRGAIVSACSVVAKSIPPYAIVAGNPGRVIGWRKKPDDVAASAEVDVYRQSQA